MKTTVLELLFKEFALATVTGWFEDALIREDENRELVDAILNNKDYDKSQFEESFMCYIQSEIFD